jgi:hypothetical protein
MLSEPLYLLGRQQQSLDWLGVLEKLDLLNNVHIALQANSFVQGTLVCKVKGTGQHTKDIHPSARSSHSLEGEGGGEREKPLAK